MSFDMPASRIRECAMTYGRRVMLMWGLACALSVAAPAVAAEGGAGEYGGEHGGNDDHHGQVTLCHIPPGQDSPGLTLTVGAEAVAAHMAHGDSMGACPSCICPAGIAACTCADGTPGGPGPDAGATRPHNLREIYGQ
ncbi:hypothetical protein [Mariprofundus erugo]|uniref:hypothetical protein n=1 Tax=Mariprofundus erugo TaxID=2528639 RepID=UPI0010FD17E8|nr:hypothetical protein [Mariprofundus erugo]